MVMHSSFRGLRFVTLALVVAILCACVEANVDPMNFDASKLTSQQRARLERRLTKDELSRLSAWERRNSVLPNRSVTVAMALEEQRYWDPTVPKVSQSSSEIERQEKEALQYLEFAPKWNHAARLVFLKQLRELRPESSEYERLWKEEKIAQEKFDAKNPTPVAATAPTTSPKLLSSPVSAATYCEGMGGLAELSAKMRDKGLSEAQTLAEIQKMSPTKSVNADVSDLVGTAYMKAGHAMSPSQFRAFFVSYCRSNGFDRPL